MQRISDFGHICANNILYIYQKNQVCERCLRGSRINAIKYKCVGNSYANSLLKVMALKIQDFRRTTKKISGFIIPAEFTAQKFREFGISKDKIHCIPTFFNTSNEGGKAITYGDFFLYFGRVDRDKGILTLVKAFESTEYKLVIIGSSIDGYDEIVKKYLEGKSHRISFLGKMDFKDIMPYLESCLCTLCPSECYDNMPNSVLESYAYCKGVIASRLGTLIDLVPDKQTGLHFTCGDYIDLRAKVRYLFENREEAMKFGKNGKEKLKGEYSENLHYEKLIQVFKSVSSEFN